MKEIMKEKLQEEIISYELAIQKLEKAKEQLLNRLEELINEEDKNDK